MANKITGATKNMLFAALVGALIAAGAHYLIMGDSDDDQKRLAMENRIKNLESSLAKKEAELLNLRLLALGQNGKNDVTTANAVTEICKQVKENQHEQSDLEQTSADVSPNSLLVLKDLATRSENDSRSFSEKVNDLLSTNPTQEKIAIVSKSIFDMASDPDSLPDYALQSIYNNQADPDLKRVVAQSLAQRGNNSLLDNFITESQTRLNSEQPTDRQYALQNLAKTHSVTAVKNIEPLLQDPDINVKLEALLALSATGNQTHVGLVEKFLKDPDPAVSSLATNVISNLKNLSESARTTISSADIAAELPRIANQ